jgi:hypothetical protein
MEVTGGPDPKKAKVEDAEKNGGVSDIPAGRSPCDDQRGLGPDADTAPSAPTLIPGGAMRARHTFTERGAARLDKNEEATDRRIGALFLLDLITSHPTWTERKIDVMTSEDTTFIGDIRVHTPSEICTDALVERVNRRRSKYVWNIFLSQSPAWTARDGEGPNLPVIEALFDPLVGKCGGDGTSLTYGDVAPCFSGGSSLTGTEDSDSGDCVHPLNVDPSTPMLAVNLWYSPDGSKSSLHFDDYHNVLCVVAGTKTVRFFLLVSVRAIRMTSCVYFPDNRCGCGDPASTSTFTRRTRWGSPRTTVGWTSPALRTNPGRIRKIYFQSFSTTRAPAPRYPRTRRTC